VRSARRGGSPVPGRQRPKRAERGTESGRGGPGGAGLVADVIGQPIVAGRPPGWFSLLLAALALGAASISLRRGVITTAAG